MSQASTLLCMLRMDWIADVVPQQPWRADRIAGASRSLLSSCRLHQWKALICAFSTVADTKRRQGRLLVHSNCI